MHVLTQEEKGSKILEAAKARFLSFGVSKTTMRDIADDLDMSVGTLYLYFQNKREIVLAIAQECRAGMDTIIQGILSDKHLTSQEKFKALFVKKFRYTNDFRSASPQGKELFAYLVQEFPERLQEWRLMQENDIRGVLEEGMRQGVFTALTSSQEVEKTVEILRIATTQFFLPAHIELPIPPSEDELLSLIDWFLDRLTQPLQVPL